MYESYYGLTEKPFNLTPDPRFVFLSDKHNEALAHLVYGIRNRSGFVMISGEIGTGKTTICRKLLGELDPGTEIAFIFNPYLSPEELLRKINEDFGIETRAQSVKDLIDELNDFLLERASEGKNCVLVIDEAQNLDPRVLEQIRLLSNLETETQKLLQIVLIGQPELAQMLEMKELRQLNQRITARYHLRELGREEALQYIAFRLRVAGGKGKIRFTRTGFGLLYRISNGTPRVINALCDRCLLIGYTKETHTISRGIVRKAAREIQGERARDIAPASPRRVTLRRVMAAAAALAIIGVFGLTASSGGLLDRAGTIADQVAMWANELRQAGAQPPDSSGTPTSGTPGNSAEPSASMLASVPTVEAAAPDPPAVPPAAPANDLAAALATLNPGAARANAASSILRVWNMAALTETPRDDSPAALERFAAANGMAIEMLESTPQQLFAINLPALVRLKAGGTLAWGALVGSQGDTVSLALDAGPTPYPVAQFEEAYAGSAAVLWLEPSPGIRPLGASANGPAVEEFQTGLASLGILDGHVQGQFDAPTRAAVERIQQAAGLHVDGVAGPQTRMVISSWRGEKGMPLLTGAPIPPDRLAALLGGASADPVSPAPIPAADSASGAVKVSELPVADTNGARLP